MLELRPNCELCDRDLPPDAADAMICTYECTFCATCVEQELRNVCPNCGGGFERRPVRPRGEWRPGTGLGSDPPGTARRALRWSRDEVAGLTARLAGVPPPAR